MLTAERAFVCLTLFDIIKMPLAMLPLLIVYMLEVICPPNEMNSQTQFFRGIWILFSSTSHNCSHYLYTAFRKAACSRSRSFRFLKIWSTLFAQLGNTFSTLPGVVELAKSISNLQKYFSSFFSFLYSSLRCTTSIQNENKKSILYKKTKSGGIGVFHYLCSERLK